MGAAVRRLFNMFFFVCLTSVCISQLLKLNCCHHRPSAAAVSDDANSESAIATGSASAATATRHTPHATLPMALAVAVAIIVPAGAAVLLFNDHCQSASGVALTE